MAKFSFKFRSALPSASCRIASTGLTAPQQLFIRRFLDMAPSWCPGLALEPFTYAGYGGGMTLPSFKRVRKQLMDRGILVKVGPAGELWCPLALDVMRWPTDLASLQGYVASSEILADSWRAYAEKRGSTLSQGGLNSEPYPTTKGLNSEPGGAQLWATCCEAMMAISAATGIETPFPANPATGRLRETQIRETERQGQPVDNSPQPAPDDLDAEPADVLHAPTPAYTPTSVPAQRTVPAEPSAAGLCKDEAASASPAAPPTPEPVFSKEELAALDSQGGQAQREHAQALMDDACTMFGMDRLPWNESALDDWAILDVLHPGGCAHIDLHAARLYAERKGVVFGQLTCQSMAECLQGYCQEFAGQIKVAHAKQS